VKLLRVIETRRFNPVGDTASLRFQGKLIAATNRDLAADIHAGRFREDLVLPSLFRPDFDAVAGAAT
jgi:DNA-binding NtrC family response regulator